jgi:hypothetical protein
LFAHSFQCSDEFEGLAGSEERRAEIGERQGRPTATSKRTGDLEHRESCDDDIPVEGRDYERAESVTLCQELRPGRMVERRSIRLGLHECDPARIAEFERFERPK